MLLLAACGNELRGPEITAPSPEQTPALGESTTAPRWVPEVCGVQTWPGAMTANVAMAVVASGSGAAIFTVDKLGGPLIGYAIDARGKMTTAGTKLTADGGFTAVSASSVDGRYVVATVAGDTTLVNLITQDFAQVQQVGKLEGSLVAARPIVSARDQRLGVTAGATGVQLASFDGAWMQSTTTKLAGPAIGMDAISFGQDALVAWSTDSGCMVQEVAFTKTATGLTSCRSPRLAAGYGNRAELAYVGAGGVQVGDLYMSGATAIASTHAIGHDSTSPRIAFDGQRYWMTYIDARGDVVVGYLTADNSSLISMALEDVSPQADAYELTIVDGQPMVFSADANGYAAHAICLTHQ